MVISSKTCVGEFTFREFRYKKEKVFVIIKSQYAFFISVKVVFPTVCINVM